MKSKQPEGLCQLLDSSDAQRAVPQLFSFLPSSALLQSCGTITSLNLKIVEVLASGSGAAFAPGGGSAHALIDLKNRQFVAPPLGGGVVQLKALIVITVETEKILQSLFWLMKILICQFLLNLVSTRPPNCI